MAKRHYQYFLGREKEGMTPTIVRYDEQARVYSIQGRVDCLDAMAEVLEHLGLKKKYQYLPEQITIDNKTVIPLTPEERSSLKRSLR